ncbi:SSI family serine proteinase inhibitor [Streptomyces sp. NPDC001595]|uniref:SSI family serine proteinase inhibitor n=1 Tax=Streptomyces sp. NPDC001532 TaxID=3154520 RepID=UPI0033346BC0
MLQVTTPHALRRLIVAAGTSLAALGSLSAAPTAAALAVPSPAAPPSIPGADRAGADHLTVTVRHTGGAEDGTFELDCHPGGGSHPNAAGACQAVDRNTAWGKEAFAPVPEGTVCTMQYGGSATAHVTGTWAGRPVDARFDRSNGCEIARWDRFVPLLPELGD